MSSLEKMKIGVASVVAIIVTVVGVTWKLSVHLTSLEIATQESNKQFKQIVSVINEIKKSHERFLVKYAETEKDIYIRGVAMEKEMRQLRMDMEEIKKKSGALTREQYERLIRKTARR